MTRSSQQLREPSMTLPGFPYMLSIARPVYEQYRAKGLITDADEKVLFRPLAMWTTPIYFTSVLALILLTRMARRPGVRDRRWLTPAKYVFGLGIFVPSGVGLQTRVLLDDRRRVLDAVRLMQEESRRRWAKAEPEEEEQLPVLPPPRREEPWWGAENEGGPEREDAWASSGQSEKRKDGPSEF
ncbi:hypothetical protein CALVIDRAFT_542976, partial [Calocera viscosa TUFC12733]